MARSAATTPGRRADFARNAGLLVSAAKELFDERGPEVALDEIARRAGVGNATLYRHFPTRRDLLVAVYAEEVAALCARGEALLQDTSPVEAFFEWMDDFVVHVATKRALAFAATESRTERRTEQFDRWLDSMRSAAGGLLLRAQEDGSIRPDLVVDDLMALVNASALAGADPCHARRMLRIVRHGIEETRTSTGVETTRT
ncbi:TetR family transcriptional regulator [Planotetraspora thailandica]|uniref:TetR family transcriptional regulator n=2 Tax=Planotetraspora thailandica TaxID=487172 RepID=A0A8J4DEB5_9ACTN|nr:TetR family transcriptional regulator [Planotetraspora thailandica]